VLDDEDSQHRAVLNTGTAHEV